MAFPGKISSNFEELDRRVVPLVGVGDRGHRHHVVHVEFVLRLQKEIEGFSPECAIYFESFNNKTTVF